MKGKINSIVYFGSDVISKGIPFLLMPFYTTLLTTEEFGQISIFNVIVEILLIITLFGGNTYYRAKFFDLAERQRNKLRYWLYQQCCYMFVFLFVCIVILYRYTEFSLLILTFAALIALFQSFVFINQSHFQSDNKPFYFGIINITSSIAIAVVTISLLLAGLKEESRYYSYLCSSVVAVGVSLYIFKFKYGYNLKENKNHIGRKDAFIYGAKLLPHALSWWVKSGCDRIIVSAVIGFGAVGVFSVASQYTMIYMVVSNAILLAYSPVMTKMLSEKKLRESMVMVLKMSVFFLFCSLLCFILSNVFFEYFIGESFKQGIEYVPYLLAASFVQSVISVVSNYFYYYDLVSRLSIFTFFSSLLHVVLAYFLSLRFEVFGVIYSSIFTYSISLFCMVFYLLKRNSRC
ncbi:TPA: hypothetical protein I7791_05725 [Vibrio vulnificus]|nr:hypothetical protein [Vibrio vulnificus]